MFTRVIVIVLDSVGIGELPDADVYGDRGSHTLGNIAARVPLAVPTLRSLGLDRLVSLGGTPTTARGAYGRMAEVSPGKDSVTGHWELMGVVLDTHGADAWVGAVMLWLTGSALFELARRQFSVQWEQIQEDIEREIVRRESL